MTDDNDDNEDVLRRSLDAVDRQRTRLVIGLAVAVVFLFLALANARYASLSDRTNVFTHAMMVTTVVWVTVVGLGIVLQMTVMTKRILRAIELASKK